MFHRDIKPKNILLKDDLNVILGVVDVAGKEPIQLEGVDRAPREEGTLKTRRNKKEQKDPERAEGT